MKKKKINNEAENKIVNKVENIMEGDKKEKADNISRSNKKEDAENISGDGKKEDAVNVSGDGKKEDAVNVSGDGKKEDVVNVSAENTEDVNKKSYIKNNFLMFVILPLCINLLIEMLNKRSALQGILYVVNEPVRFFCSTLIIVMLLIPALLLKRRVFYVSLVSALFISFGIINCVLRGVRVSPFNPSDISVLSSAISLVNKYFTPGLIVLAVIAVCICGFIILLLFLKGPRISYKINYWKNLLVVGITIVITIIIMDLAINVNIFSTKFTNLTTAYDTYGFVYSFSIGMINKGIKKPSDYSEETINDILSKQNDEYTENGEVKLNDVEDTPNIIFLQLESFFDIKNVEGLEFSTDPIPYFEKLQSEYSTGYLNVFNVGYGTCNTEFEIMTGMNLDDFGPGEIPYKSILKDTICESIAFDLKDYGYKTHVIHNNDATFYSRKTVFPNIGYDTFTSIEYMNIQEFTYTGWAKDKYLADEIVDTLKSTDEQDYIYTISVQGHGSYPTEKVLDNPTVTLVNGVGDEGRDNAIEYYANQINEMDTFVEDLINKVNALGEDTIIVMYGDHLPGLGLSENDLVNKNLYQTEYIIWDNMGLKKEDKELETYQLAATVMKKLNINSGVINRYHQEYLDEDLSQEDEKDYLSGLQNLEYDILYGDKIVYGGDVPYTATNMIMGIREISITSINKVNDGDKNYVEIKGKNFNSHSVVYINGDDYDTEFIDTETLRVKYDDLKTLDSFVVSQADADSGYVIGSTKEMLYYG